MRPRRPWYRKSKDAWFVMIDGKQKLLAKGKAAKAEAEAAFYRMMAAGGMVPANENGLRAYPRTLAVRNVTIAN